MQNFSTMVTQKLSKLSNVPNIIKGYSTDVLSMFIKVHVTVKCDANVYAGFRLFRLLQG